MYRNFFVFIVDGKIQIKNSRIDYVETLLRGCSVEGKLLKNEIRD